MRRRTYLACSAGAIGGLAGCSGILGGSGGDGEPEGPAEVAEAFLEVLIDGDVEAANDLIHEDAAVDEVDQSNVESFQSVNAELEGASVQSREDDRAVVEVRISGVTDEGERDTVSFRWELRTEDGEWRVYEDLSAFGSPPRAPAVQWESSTRTNDDGDATAVVFEHGGGDTVDATNLQARAGGQTADPPEQGGDVQVADAIVVPLDGDGEVVDDRTDVRLVWADPERDGTQVLAQHTLTTPAAGSLGARVRLEP